MKHSLFDKIFLGFLFVFIVAFMVMVLYASSSSRTALVNERIEVLTNETYLIADQSIAGYYRGLTTLEDLQNSFDYYSETLNASVWLVDVDGNLIVSSAAKDHPPCPSSIRLFTEDLNLTEPQAFTGRFFNLFPDEVISVAIPIQTNGNPNGMILLHSTVAQLHNLQSNIIRVVYVPFLIMVILAFLLLALISSKIMRPIRKINTVAEEYATGNFETAMDIHSNDEIGQLAATLEYMASELSKLDEYRKSFISNISHDFRSPLTSIKGYIEAIIDGTIPPEKQDRYLGIVLNETNRLTKLTNGLLELNNFDSYGIWLMPKEFDLVSLVNNAINTFEGKCIDKQVRIISNNNVEHPTVYADKTKIQQVIYNLVDNAIKFTDSGKSIYITLTEKHDKIYISVKDEGCGIPADSLNKIWVRFYKADASRGKDRQGTGLGLSITREIIKAHKENITVVSTEGVGSEFTFSLSKPGQNVLAQEES